MNIKWLHVEEIEQPRWDGCVHYAHNSNPYGYSWYLKNSAREWMALVEGNYESVLPLPIDFEEREWIRMPSLLPYVNLYSVHVLSEKRLARFANELSKSGKNWELSTGIAFQNLTESGPLGSRKFISLRKSYEEIKNLYSSDFKDVLNGSKGADIHLIQSQNAERLVAFIKKNGGDMNEHMAHRLLYNAMHRGLASIQVATRDGEWIAAAAILYGNGSARLWMYGTEQNIQGKAALAQILNYQFMQLSGKPLYFEMPGDLEKIFPDIPGKTEPVFHYSSNS